MYIYLKQKCFDYINILTNYHYLEKYIYLFFLIEFFLIELKAIKFFIFCFILKIWKKKKISSSTLNILSINATDGESFS
jgi:hypothetical protein